MEQRLLGKVAIITGSGQGIGKGIAQRLAREGAHVVIAEYNAESAAAAAHEIEAAGGRALAYRVDISDVAAVQRMVDDVAAQLGHIDILVNNAGVVQTKPMLDLTEADWDRVLDVNLRGTFFLVQAVARQMIKQMPEALREAASKPADIFATKKPAAAAEGVESEPLAASYGKIVSLSSVAGRRGRPLQTHYAASKAGDHQPDPVDRADPGALSHQRQRGLPRHRADADVDRDRQGARQAVRREAGRGDGRVHQHRPAQTRRHRRRHRRRRGLFLLIR